MSIYAIGDIQGCYDSFRRLLDKIEFDPDKDQVWLTGDLVNRGPKSLKTLRFVRSLGNAAVTVLGNHDLHLLALANGIDDAGDPGRTLSKVLDADDCDELLDWLRRLPLAHFDASAEHAAGACRFTAEMDDRQDTGTGRRSRSRAAEQRLSCTAAQALWRQTDALVGQARGLQAIAVHRQCPDTNSHGRRQRAPRFRPQGTTLPTRAQGLVPWFEASEARWRETRIVFGHWSALGLVVKPGLICVDTGCVWKRDLTAVQLNGPTRIVQVDCRCR
jgi:bis(5'-nucleosyl)-tetraphosphatase (symmetrical)